MARKRKGKMFRTVCITKRWTVDGGRTRKKLFFLDIKSSNLPDFPEMSEEDLTLPLTECYQLSEAVYYFSEIPNDDGSTTVQYLKQKSNAEY